MSAFICAQCENLRDADDGCDEAAPGSFDLICVDCMEAREAEADEASPAQAASPAAGSVSHREEPK